MRRRELLTAGGLTVPLQLLIRLDDALALLPTPTRASSASEISTRLAGARQRFDASDLTGLVADLPDLLAVAHEAAEQDGDPAAHARLAACSPSPRPAGWRRLAWSPSPRRRPTHIRELVTAAGHTGRPRQHGAGGR